jgi:hypothetical protein
MAAQERRSFPRIHDEGLSLKLNAGDFDTITHTQDISASGLYCKVSKPIPLMSRVSLSLMLSENKPLDVEGVVVREHAVVIDGVIKHYDIAIFFDSLSEKNKIEIQEYISRKK